MQNICCFFLYNGPPCCCLCFVLLYEKEENKKDELTILFLYYPLGYRISNEGKSTVIWSYNNITFDMGNIAHFSITIIYL